MNNNVENLEWISNINNMKHSFKIGTHKGSMLGKKGQDHPRNILSIQDIIEIKNLFQNDFKIKKIADMYNVSYRTISRSIKNEKY